MKQKTSKYLAALIIVLGLIFMYFIPNCHGQDQEITEIFNNNNILLFVENIRVEKKLEPQTITFRDKNGKIINDIMFGTIVVSNDKNNNKVGEDKLIAPFIACSNTSYKTRLPDAALIVIYPNGDEHKYYAKNGKVTFNNIDVDTIKSMIKNGRQ